MKYFHRNFVSILTLFFIFGVKSSGVPSKGDVGNKKYSLSPRGAICNINGLQYQDQQIAYVLNSCRKVKCNDGTWLLQPATTMNKDCKHCHGVNDPHWFPSNTLITNTKYEYHYICSHAVLQKDVLPVTSVGPMQTDFGVFTDFRKCTTTSAKTCFDRTNLVIYPPGGSKRVDILFTHSDTVKYEIKVHKSRTGGLPLNGNVTHLGISGSIGKIVSGAVTTDGTTSEADVLLFHDKIVGASCIVSILPHSYMAICPNGLWLSYIAGKGGVYGLCGQFKTGDNVAMEYRKSDNTLAKGKTEALKIRDFGKSWEFNNGQICVENARSETIELKGDTILSEATCRGYTKHLNKCTEIINEFGRKLKDGIKNGYISSCLGDFCSASNHARSNSELTRELTMWEQSARESVGIANSHVTVSE